MAWRRAAIAGVGATRQGKLPDETPLSLAAEALRLALEDSGIDKREIDGLLTMPGTTSPEGSKNYLNVGELLGIDPRFTGSLTMGGATGGALVQIAAMAIATGMAKHRGLHLRRHRAHRRLALRGGGRAATIPGASGACSAMPPTAPWASAATWRSTARARSTSAGSR